MPPGRGDGDVRNVTSIVIWDASARLPVRLTEEPTGAAAAGSETVQIIRGYVLFVGPACFGDVAQRGAAIRPSVLDQYARDPSLNSEPPTPVTYGRLAGRFGFMRVIAETGAAFGSQQPRPHPPRRRST